MSAASIAFCLLAIGASPPRRAVGVNLDFHRSSSSHLLFVDAMMRAKPWVPFVPAQRGWDSGAEVPTGPLGLPLEVPFVPPEGGPPQWVRTVMFDRLEGRYPGGRYVLEYDGTGVVAVSGDTEARVFAEAGRFPIEVHPGESGIQLEIRSSRREDPIRDLRLWLPGFEGAREPLHPQMVRRLQGFSVLRPHQSMRINGGDYPCDNRVAPSDPGCVQSWRFRPRPEHLTQATTRGVALEHLVDLANRAGSDLWPGVPHAADDGWVRGAAALIRDRLAPGRRVYVELSNEIWNFDGSHPQHDYFRGLGRRLQLYPSDMPEDDTDAGRRAYVQRTAQVWRIFDEVLGPTHAVVRVISGFLGNPWHSGRILRHLRDRALNPGRVKADALAVGAYFGAGVADALIDEGLELRATPEAVLDRVEASLGQRGDPRATETFADLVRAHADLAKRHRVSLIAYEGGPRLVVGAGEPSPLNEALHAAHRDPRMAEVYARALDLWFGLGGGVFTAYVFVQRPDRFGAFGHLEYMGQPLAEAPKLQALRSRMEAFGVELPKPEVRLTPGPRWELMRTGTFPSSGVLVPLHPISEPIPAP